MNHEEDTPTNEAVSSWSGLTKREVFAKDAMKGLLSAGKGVNIYGRTESTDPKDIASVSCIYADALIAELNKPQGESTK